MSTTMMLESITPGAAYSTSIYSHLPLLEDWEYTWLENTLFPDLYLTNTGHMVYAPQGRDWNTQIPSWVDQSGAHGIYRIDLHTNVVTKLRSTVEALKRKQLADVF